MDGSVPTNGVTRIAETNVWIGAIAPSTVTVAGSIPISSWVSRNAVARRSTSPGSASPPGNDTSPGCRDKPAARSVNTKTGSSPSITSASTAARRSPGAG